MTLDEHQERHIAQGLREGRTDAWRALHEAYAERVWRGVARLLGPSRDDVADVVQETMMEAARSARAFDPARGSLWSWLWGITHHRVALHWRKEGQRCRLVEAVAAHAGRLVGVGASLDPEPHEVLVTAELAMLVRAALAELTAEYVMLLTARYLDGVEVAELAVQEHCSEVAMRSRLARARQAFREAFEKYRASE